RFQHIEKNRIDLAMSEIGKRNDAKDIYKEASLNLGADLYLLVSAAQIGNVSYARINVIPLNPEFSKLRRDVDVKSMIMMNIPLLLGREIIMLHERMPVKAKILRKYSDNQFLINAGQWHGIKSKRYQADNGDWIDIVLSGRKESIVRIQGKKWKPGDIILINIFPEIKELLNGIVDNISRNTVYKYGIENTLLKGTDAGKRFVEGICIVNTGGNICLPGYGAFLSTHYLGFRDVSPDSTGIAVSSTSIFLQFLLPELITGFSINFFPWVKDSDKSSSLQGLQIFLWASLPFTFSTAYMDQLAYLYKSSRILPPFFEDKDIMAGVLSFLLPGGGYFYKGRRVEGWSFYISEMSLAGYGIYCRDSKRKRLIAFSALAVVKIIDIAWAYFVRSSFSFYNREVEREVKKVSYGLELRKNPIDGNTFYTSLNYKY
ncbi:MAG: hypothetical protein SVR08_09835, partial [Spirochaetota bacterium]|nr:hypothetical protein [Spirochaetota bacterium]